MSGDLEIDVKVSASQAQVLRELISKLDEVEAGVKKVEKAGENWNQRWSRALEGRIAAFNQLSGAIGTVTGTIAGATRAVVQGAVAHEQEERALRALGGAYEMVRAATNDTVTAQQALALQQGLVQSGMQVTGEELAAITRRARDYALATGTETTAAIEQLTDALRGGESEGLRRFGVAVTEGQNRTVTFRQALAQFTREQQGARVATRSTGEEVAAFGRDVSRAFNDISAAVVGFVSHLAQARTGVAGFFGGVLRDVRGFPAEVSNVLRNGVGTGANDVARNANRIRDLQVAQARLRRSVSADTAIADLTDDEVLELSRTRRGADEYAAGIAEIRAARPGRMRAARDAREGREQESAFDASYREAVADGDAREQRIRSGVVRGLETVRGTREQREINRRLRRMGITPPGEHASGGDHDRDAQDELMQTRSQAAFWENARQVQERRDRGRDALEERTRDENAANRAYAERRAQSSRDDANFADDQRYAQRQAGDAGVQFAERFEMGARRTQTAAQQMAAGVRGAFDSMTGSFKTHLAALIQGKENVGDALRAILHETLLNLATESAVKALFNTAQGFANIAMQNYPAAAASFTAAGIYAAVAAVAGGGAALTAPTQASAGAAAAGGGGGRTSDRPASTGGNGGAVGGMNVYHINVNGALATREDVQDVVRRASDGGFARNQLTTSERADQRRRAA